MAGPPWRHIGIRGRVVLSFLVLLLLAEVASVVVLRQVGTARMREQARRDLVAVTDEFRTEVDPTASTIGTTDGPSLGSLFDDFLRRRPARADQAYLTFLDGRPFAASAGAPVDLDQLPTAAAWATTASTDAGQVTTPVGRAEWVAVPVTSGDRVLGVLVATQFLAGQERALSGTVVTVSLVTFLVLVAAALLAWVAAGRALAPLRDLAVTAATVSGGDDLDARIDVRSTDEVGALAASLNGMLDRLRGAFDAQKRFLDDAGHELRTPITIVRGHVELLDDDPDKRAEEVALVLDELDRMERLVTDLRTLARAERPDFLQTGPVDCQTLVEEIARKAAALAPRSWTVHADATGTIVADRQRLTQALLALADNAVRVTDDGDPMELGSRRSDRGLVLWLADKGPGIDPEDVPTLFERTGRRVRKRPGGTGLGLPIVDAIARAHGGEVHVTSALGAGTRMEIEIPEVRA